MFNRVANRAGMQPERIIPFENATRRKLFALETKPKPTNGGAVTWELPTTGLLQQIWLQCSVSIAGTLSAPNAVGQSSVIKRVYARVNAGHFLFDLSGAGYNFLVKQNMFDGRTRCGYNDALLAVTTGTKNLDAIIPVCFNDRDQIGFLNLQNRATQVTLTVEFEADTTVATGAVVTGTITPVLILFEPPSNPKSFPDLTTIHQYLEDNNIIAGAGQADYTVQLGGTLAGVSQLVVGTTYSLSQLLIQQSNTIEAHTPESMRLQYMQVTGQDLNLTGTAITGYNTRTFYDFAGTDGLGHYGSERDWIDTNQLTYMVFRNTYAGAGSVRTVREQIIKLAA